MRELKMKRVEKWYETLPVIALSPVDPNVKFYGIPHDPSWCRSMLFRVIAHNMVHLIYPLKEKEEISLHEQ